MQEKSKEYNEKEQQVAENRSRNTLFERRENLQKQELRCLPELRLKVAYLKKLLMH